MGADSKNPIEDSYHAVSLSGGKDSTAMLLLMIERDMPIDVENSPGNKLASASCPMRDSGIRRWYWPCGSNRCSGIKCSPPYSNI